MEDTKKEFDTELFKTYVKEAKKAFPDVDLNLLEYACGSYIYYDLNGVEKPIDEENNNFINANKEIQELIARTKELDKELERNKSTEVSITA